MNGIHKTDLEPCILLQDILVDGSNDTVIRVSENNNGIVIGNLTAMDEDVGDGHQFYITASDGGRFVVEDGKLKVGIKGKFDKGMYVPIWGI